MCGIAGILSLAADTPVELGDLRTMAAQLVHRGPDADGFYRDPQGRCGLAFRRLAIIDLATGDQPIANDDGSIQLVFNGEIYNFRELRRELEGAGHRFRTQSDSEVIVRAYEQWGEQCLQRLAGMFALALWDAPRGRLLLARDRLGKKPLAYATNGGRLFFASELKAILALPGVARELDPQSLHRYLLFQYVPAPHSIYRDFRKLQPGHSLTWSAGASSEPQQQPYWRLPEATLGDRHSTPDTGTAPAAARYVECREEIGRRLTRAVEKRLISDVPLGAFLSGGIDSSIVVALMRRLGVSPLRTFSIGFADPRYDESAHARLVARHFGTEHHEHVVTPQAREVLDTLAYHYDEPFGDSSAIPTYYVSRHTRESVTVALTGDGGDECFGGYERYRAAQLAGRAAWLPRPLRAGMAAAAGWLPRGGAKSRSRRAFRFLSALGVAAPRRYLNWMNVFTPEHLTAGYAPEFAERIDFEEPLHWFEALYAEPATRSPARRAMHTDLLSYLPGDLLTKVDIASMACSLECRAPFLDHDLVELAATLPTNWLIRAGRGKHILRDWAARLLPPEILRRGKMGFGVPIGEWFRGDLAGLLEHALLAPDSICPRIFRATWLRQTLDAHCTGRENHEHRLWALLMLALWAQRWQPHGC